MSNFLTSLFSRLATLISVLALTFLLLHLVPGGPFDSDRKLPPEIENNLYERYGLHRRSDFPTFLEWFARDSMTYAKQISEGRLGPSLKYVDRDVGEIILSAIPPSFTLGAASLTLSLGLALLTAILLAYRDSHRLENLFSVLASLTISMPSFMKAVLLVSIFSITLGWFPPALWEGPSHAVLPVMTLALAPYFLMLEFLLSEIKRERTKLYALAARAKGVSEKRVLLKHVLRNSLNPLLALLGPIATSLVTGSFIVEMIFSIPGLGRHFVLAVVDRDYFLVMGITLVFAGLLIGFNWFTDIVSRRIDPRITA